MKVPLALLAILLVGSWYVQPQRVAVVTQSAAAVQAAPPAPSATTGRQPFARALAQAFGNNAPSESIVLFIESWTKAEGVPESINNPLATTMPRPNSTCYNWLCVRAYDSMATGVEATAATLRGDYPGYAEIVAGIQQNNPQRALLGLAASPWGTSAQLTMQVYNEAIAARRVPQAQPVAYTPADTDAPRGNPLNRPGTVVTQGYGVGSHAPAATMGGLDLALAGPPSATQGAPIYAMLGGTVRVSQSWPCGNGVEIVSGSYKVLYCHLQEATVPDGATVQAGQAVALAGSSGASSGPHLHVAVSKDGQNVNPLDYVTK